jgi:GNAT superfamily N-acetyltransferase
MNEPFSADALQAKLQQVRGNATSYLTNLYLTPSQLASRLQRGLQVISAGERLVLLVRPEEGCSRLFFAGEGSELVSALAGKGGQLAGFLPLVTDVIGPAASVRETADTLCAAGFRPYLRLIRLSRMGEVAFQDEGDIPAGCDSAVYADLPAVSQLLRRHFDLYTDQLPCREELGEAADAGWLRVSRHQGEVDGFLWYEKTGATSVIKYWCTDSAARGRGVGGRLMRDYFQLTRGCARHLLWVRENNQLALSCYSHYGYQPDGVQDQILMLER